ncbi:thioredoxin-like 3-3 isoform X1 [Solanum lycopersicum]|uniref:Thioredoxin domain-containing protein n=2 Tax=Solanum lycopersicum TaxID=4081 RepID=A0A3Q7HWB9_SOLLC|nr:thioredoxin-like 3-3 isoform X1 [Solanum lycopersicum]
MFREKEKVKMGEGGEKAVSRKLPVNKQANIMTATGDENLEDIFHTIRTTKTPAVINYGVSWCRVCNQILPTFWELSKKFPKLSFVYADIDECPETTQNLRYTPTFQFYRDGERVDEMFGGGDERLHDRLWLHS